jgi:uncharacterized membrane protein
MTRWLFAVLVGIWLAMAGTAHADRTGGSMGGGSWGSTPSSTSVPSSSSSSGGWTSNGVSPSYSSSNHTSFNDGGSGAGGGVMVLAALVFVICFIVVAVKRYFHDLFRGGQENHSNLDAYVDNSKDLSFANYTDVTVLRIGIDARARKLVQTELARIAKVADKTTPEGRAATLREVALLLRRLKDSWVFGGAVNEQMREAQQQMAVFDKHVEDAKTRFQAITPVSGADPVILVTIVIAAHNELFEVGHIGDGDDLRLALESASHRSAEDLIALEMIWVPAGDEVPPSAVDVQRAYPTPGLIPIATSLAGKVICASCGGPFASELVTCPHCGAPAAHTA